MSRTFAGYLGYAFPPGLNAADAYSELLQRRPG